MFALGSARVSDGHQATIGRFGRTIKVYRRVDICNNIVKADNSMNSDQKRDANTSPLRQWLDRSEYQDDSPLQDSYYYF